MEWIGLAGYGTLPTNEPRVVWKEGFENEVACKGTCEDHRARGYESPGKVNEEELTELTLYGIVCNKHAQS